MALLVLRYASRFVLFFAMVWRRASVRAVAAAGAGLATGLASASVHNGVSTISQLDAIESRMEKIERVVGNHSWVPKINRHTGPASVPGEPLYTTAQVSEHDNSKPGVGIWVTYRDGVYDVTEFADIHPGGATFIKQAAGGPVDAWWQYWAYHHLSTKVGNFLEQYRIGRLSDWSGDPATVSQGSGIVHHIIDAEDDDLYIEDGERTTEQLVFFKQPYNSETRSSTLKKNYLTPNEHFYVRNHAPVPQLDSPDKHYITFTIGVPNSPGEKETASMTLQDLTTKFGTATVTSIMQCAGNRAADDIEALGPSGFSGTPYQTIGIGMLGNAQWSGPRLVDVLEELYPATMQAWRQAPEDAKPEIHVVFEGADGYATSTPLSRIAERSNDCLVATRMNGQALPKDHGYPARALLPGIAGARNVKWLTKITLSTEEAESAWQASYYKDHGQSLQGLPLNSVVLSPEPGDKLVSSSGAMPVSGVAYSGHAGETVTSVEVSADQGGSWHKVEVRADEVAAHADNSSKRHGWVRWQGQVPLPASSKSGEQVQVWCRAATDKGTVQPAVGLPREERGSYLYNGYHKVPVTVK